MENGIAFEGISLSQILVFPLDFSVFLKVLQIQKLRSGLHRHTRRVVLTADLSLGCEEHCKSSFT